MSLWVVRMRRKSMNEQLITKWKRGLQAALGESK